MANCFRLRKLDTNNEVSVVNVIYGEQFIYLFMADNLFVHKLHLLRAKGQNAITTQTNCSWSVETEFAQQFQTRSRWSIEVLLITCLIYGPPLAKHSCL